MRSLELQAIFLQRGPDGRRRFTNGEIRHFLPMVVLSTRADLRSFPALRPMMTEFIQKLTLPRMLTPDGFARAVHAYYRAHPANRELEKQFFAFCRTNSASAGAAPHTLDPRQVAKYTKVAAATVKRAPPQAAAQPKQSGFWGAIRNFARSMG